MTGVLRAAALTCVTVVVVLVALTVLPALLGWRSSVVLSGSMAPRILAGDVVVSSPVAAGDVLPGQVVLFDDPAGGGAALLHRTVQVQPDGSLITRGDANTSDDSSAVAASSVRGLPRLRVPYVGLPVVWLHERRVAPLLGLVVVAGLLTAALVPARPEPVAADA